ncbi:MAG TPA: hypothetical protein VGE43_09980 [Acidimicrobiales bacterium]
MAASARSRATVSSSAPRHVATVIGCPTEARKYSWALVEMSPAFSWNP